jgi:hypothetical protein
MNIQMNQHTLDANSERKENMKENLYTLFIYNVWLWREKRDEKNRRQSKRRDEKVLIRKRREL